MLEVGFFIPEYVDPGTICLKQNGKTGEYRMENNFLFANLLLKPGEKLELEFDMPLRLEKAPGRYSGEESKVVMYGPQILAAVTGEDQDDTAAEDLMPAGNGWFRNTHNGSLWIPVGEFTYADKENAISRRARVIFKQRI